jgi:formylglycine-generating enzyme required for sulfatase activity
MWRALPSNMLVILVAIALPCPRPAENSPGPEKGRIRVIRGGGWLTGPGCMGESYCLALSSNRADFDVGFRCARDATPEAEGGR